VADWTDKIGGTRHVWNAVSGTKLTRGPKGQKENGFRTGVGRICHLLLAIETVLGVLADPVSESCRQPPLPTQLIDLQLIANAGSRDMD